MPVLSPTPLFGEIVYLGLVTDRSETLCSDPVETMQITFAGPAGECHGGLTRPSCARVTAQYPKGTEIRNTRQLSILSDEELSVIAAEMGIPEIRPAWLGATVVLRGIPDLTLLPPGSRLQAPGGATITVDVENGPCKYPAEIIERHHPGKGRGFIAAARARRGLVGWVEREGTLAVGEALRLHTPPNRIYPHLPAA